MNRWIWTAQGALAVWMIAGVTGARADAGLTPLVGVSGAPQAPWHLAGLPHQSKPATRYSIVTLGSERVLRILADNSYGNLVHALPSLQGAHQLSWRWRLDEANALVDLRQRSGDDSAVKVCLMFDLPLETVPFFERQLLSIARSSSTEPLPAASICYVWDAKLAPGTALDNAFSRRVRYLVLQGPQAPLATWRSEKRDINADWKRLFGDEATSAPPLIGVAVAGDADNTHGHSLAHVADVNLD